MANYYNEKKRAFLDLAKLLDKAKEERKKELKILNVTYWLTEKYEVGELTIMKRLKLLEQIRADFNIVGDTIVFK